MQDEGGGGGLLCIFVAMEGGGGSNWLGGLIGCGWTISGEFFYGR